METMHPYAAALMTDDEAVRNAISKIAEYYNLKHTVRWSHERPGDETESVAEHVYGMHLLLSFFTPLVDASLDRVLLSELATWHDLAEAYVGDMTTRTKTEDHKEREKVAEAAITESSAPHLKETVATVFLTYDARSTPEARFVKAIDKIEPMFHLYFLHRTYGTLHTRFNLGWSAEEYRAHRDAYLKDYLLLKRFDDFLYEETKQFHPPA